MADQYKFDEVVLDLFGDMNGLYAAHGPNKHQVNDDNTSYHR